MVTTDTSGSKASESGSDGATSTGPQTDGASTTRRKLSDEQEREVTRLYAETETPVSEISKRLGIGESSVYRVAQRRGAALRGRLSTSTPSAAAAAMTPSASGMGLGPGRGRAVEKSTSRRSAVTSTTGRARGGSNGRAAASSTGGTAGTTPNSRRTRGTRTPQAQTTARRGRTSPSVDATAGTALTTRSAGGSTRVSGGSTRGASGSTRPTAAITRREFRVSYVAVRVFVAADMADAIHQAEAAGATDITGIQRND